MNHQKFINHRVDFHHTPPQALEQARIAIEAADWRVLAQHGWAGPMQQLVHNPLVQELIVPHAGQVIAINNKGERTAEPVVMSNQWIDFLPQLWFKGQGRPFPSGIVRDTLLFPSGAGIRYVYSPASVSLWGPSLYIRRLPFADKPTTLDDLVQKGSLPGLAADLLRILLKSGTPMLVTGATSAGKTTMLAALIHELQATNNLLNILVVERSHEIGLATRAFRWAESENLSLDVLAEKATQMGIDWLVLGECTGGEAYFVAKAFTQGVPALSTLHAWSSAYAFKQLALLSQEYPKAPPPRSILHALASLGMFCVQLERKIVEGKTVRRTVSISEIVGVMGDDPVVNDWWRWNNEAQQMEWNPGCITEMGPATSARLTVANVTLPMPEKTKRGRT